MAIFSLTLLAYLLGLSLAYSHAILTVNTTANTPPVSERNLVSTDLTSCALPKNSVSGEWYYENIYFSSRFIGCTAEHDKVGAWTMLNAYRSGGKKNIHWQYIQQGDRTKCLKNWSYYDKSGKKLIAKIDGYSTTLGDKDKKPWCAMLIYRKGGVRGYQWDYCTCP